MNTTLPNTLTFPQQLEHIKSNMKLLGNAQPDVMTAFSGMHSASSTEGVLSSKTKELIALAIAVAVHCDGCISFHTHDSLKAGASPEEIAEALGVAILMGGGPSVMYATHVMDAIEQFQASDS